MARPLTLGAGGVTTFSIATLPDVVVALRVDGTVRIPVATPAGAPAAGRADRTDRAALATLPGAPGERPVATPGRTSAGVVRPGRVSPQAGQLVRISNRAARGLILVRRSPMR
jgi:hypothetical protein